MDMDQNFISTHGTGNVSRTVGKNIKPHKLHSRPWLIFYLALAIFCFGNQSIYSSASTDLISAAYKGNIKKVKALLKGGAAVNATWNDGATALIAAAQTGHVEVLNLLLSHRAEVNWQMNNSSTALIEASFYGHKNAVQKLIAHGAKLELTKRGWSPLMVAAQNGHTEVVRLLITQGAKLGVTNNKGLTALIVAAEEGHIKVVQHLLAQGADVNKSSWSGAVPLPPAAQNGHTDVVKLLLAQGASVNQQSRALVLAAEKGHRDVVILLLANKARINHKRHQNGATAILSASKNGHTEIVQLLLDRGAKINLSAYDDSTALTVAKTTEIRRLLNKAIKESQAKKNSSAKRSPSTASTKSKHSWVKDVHGREFEVEKDSSDRVQLVVHEDFAERYTYKSDYYNGEIPYVRVTYESVTEEVLSTEVTGKWDRLSRQLTAIEVNVGSDARPDTLFVWDYRWQSPIVVHVEDSNGIRWELRFKHNRHGTKSTYDTFMNGKPVDGEKALKNFRPIEILLGNRFKRWGSPFNGT